MIHTNSLTNESSPYLLQHAHNPVNWFPWGNKALDKAKEENKPIIVSIGYAACHWCHVMEHESFEDEEVAQIMNDNFISIKVDREERPDIDQVYMNALQLITGAGGWPLNCILLPDTRPVYGATYFPKAQWVGVLKQVSNYIKNNPEKAKQQAETITQAIQSSEAIFSGNETIAFTTKDLDNIFNSWKINIDYINGGNKGAPKFPMPVDWEFLLSYHDLTGNEDALKAVTTTLNKMGDGGIYDHIGGGFARYSTDDYWKVPHFEKMLYDNAQLVSLYSLAYKHTKTEQYKSIVSETLSFIQRELTSKEGGFYSSLDADTENEEGKFYVWTKNELEGLLGDKSRLVIDYFNISEQGNWEKGQNILFKSANDKEIAENYKITETKLSEQISEAKHTLLKARAKRTAPGLDDKILTSWNSLMLKAYVDAYRVFENQKYLDTALKNADFINTKLKADDNRLNRNYKNNNSSINGFLDDYAFTIEAFISLYKATSDKQWLIDAKELLDYTITHFFDKNTGMFFYTSNIDPELIARKTEVTDNVIPSSNSQMAKNLFMLGHYLNMDKYSKKSEQMLNNIKQNALKHGHYYANWNILATWFAKGPSEIDIIK